MKLIILGSAGYHPNPQRDTACVMIPELGLIFDAGTGLFRARDYLQTRTLDIFLSHAHLDHVVGLTYYFDLMYERQLDRIRVHGAADKLAAIRTHLFAPPLFPAEPPFEFCPLVAPVDLPYGGRVSFFPLEHPGGSLGFRLAETPRSLAYVTDTTASAQADYVPHIRGVDTLLHECNFPNGFEDLALRTGHSCLTPVLQVASAAGAGRLFLLHLSPLLEGDDPLGLAPVRSVFPAAVVAHDGMEIEL